MSDNNIKTISVKNNDFMYNCSIALHDFFVTS